MKSHWNKAKFYKTCKRLVATVTSLIVMLSVICLTTVMAVGAEEDSAKTAITAVYQYELSQASVEDADAYLALLCENAGTSAADWAFLNLMASNECLALGITREQGMAYANAMTEYVNQTQGLKSTDLERIALVYGTLGLEPAWCAKVVNTSFGAAGIMSMIYGLRVYGLCTSQSEEYGAAFLEACELTPRQMLEALMACQRENGGFGLGQDDVDCDVTAMAVRAMGLWKDEEAPEGLEQCVIDAFACLEARQQEDGTYASFGVTNAESTAQVLMACRAWEEKLTIPFLSENGGGKRCCEALLTFQTEDGGFAHAQDGTSNALASMQAWEALLTTVDDEAVVTDGFTLRALFSTDGVKELLLREIRSLDGMGIRLILAGAIVVLYFMVCVYWVCTGVRKPHRYLLGLAIGAVLVGLLFILRVETPKEYRDRMSQSQGNVTTTIEIRGYDQTILASTTINVGEKDTVYDQLLYATSLHTIGVSYSGSTLFSNIYIRQIGDLAEFDYGPESGWMYSVNGAYPQVGCSAYTLSKGDVVIWTYTVGEEETP